MNVNWSELDPQLYDVEKYWKNNSPTLAPWMRSASLLTLNKLVFSPMTKLMASMKLDLPDLTSEDGDAWSIFSLQTRWGRSQPWTAWEVLSSCSLCRIWSCSPRHSLVRRSSTRCNPILKLGVTKVAFHLNELELNIFKCWRHFEAERAPWSESRIIVLQKVT